MKRPVFTLGRPLGASLLLGGLLAAALAASVASWAELESLRDERDAKAELLERSVEASRRARVAPTGGVADPFVPGDTATLAAAAVDADLRALAAGSGLALLSSRSDVKPGEPDAAAIGTRIEDQAVVEGGNGALQSLLAALADGTPAVVVDSLTLEPAEGAEGDPQDPRLRASLTLSAYWRPARLPAR